MYRQRTLRASDRFKRRSRKEQPIIVSPVLLVYVVVIGGVMIFMMSRSQKKQRAQQALTQSALTVGAEVRTIGGLLGEVVEVTDEHVVIETTPGVQLKFVKNAIAGVTAAVEPDEPEEAAGDEADGGSAGDAEFEDAAVDSAAESADAEVPAKS